MGSECAPACKQGGAQAGWKKHILRGRGPGAGAPLGRWVATPQARAARPAASPPGPQRLNFEGQEQGASAGKYVVIGAGCEVNLSPGGGAPTAGGRSECMSPTVGALLAHATVTLRRPTRRPPPGYPQGPTTVPPLEHQLQEVERLLRTNAQTAAGRPHGYDEMPSRRTQKLWT